MMSQEIWTTVVVRMQRSSASVESMRAVIAHNEATKLRESTFDGIVRAKALSKGMAHKAAAASGLTFKRPVASHRRKGRDGLASLFNDSTAGFVRVTKSSRIIDSVNDCLTK